MGKHGPCGGIPGDYTKCHLALWWVIWTHNDTGSVNAAYDSGQVSVETLLKLFKSLRQRIPGRYLPFLGI